VELRGTVIKGRQLGRQLGVPTANISLATDAGVERGVYAARVDGPGLRGAPAMAYIGSRPAIDDAADGQLTLEVHVLDFEGDLYGAELSLRLGEKVRDEAKPATIEALRQRIADNLARVRAHFRVP